MTAYWDLLSITVGDRLFGWMLALPRDLTIVLLAVMLGLVIVGIRWMTADQAILQQLFADERRLRELSRQARENEDDERLNRIRQLRGMLIRRRLSADFLPLSLATLVLLVWIPWADQRLAFHALDHHTPVHLVARFPSAMIGELVHMVPIADVTSETGWVQTVSASIVGGVTHGRAEWIFSTASPDTFRLIEIRLRNQTISHRLQVGTGRYERPVQHHAGGIETEVALRPYRPLGVIPAWIWPGLPGWTLFLSLITAAVIWIGNRLLRAWTPG